MLSSRVLQYTITNEAVNSYLLLYENLWSRPRLLYLTLKNKRPRENRLGEYFKIEPISPIFQFIAYSQIMPNATGSHSESPACRMPPPHAACRMCACRSCGSCGMRTWHGRCAAGGYPDIRRIATAVHDSALRSLPRWQLADCADRCPRPARRFLGAPWPPRGAAVPVPAVPAVPGTSDSQTTGYSCVLPVATARLLALL